MKMSKEQEKELGISKPTIDIEALEAEARAAAAQREGGK